MSTQPKAMTITGWILTVLVSAMLVMSATFKLKPPPEILEGWVKSGFPAEALLPIGIVELACVVLYLVPQTAVLGAILLVGYLGGAVATHVRTSEPFIMPIAIGVVAWLGLFLRDSRIRALVPIRTRLSADGATSAGAN